jgi:hypothetical protein
VKRKRLRLAATHRIGTSVVVRDYEEKAFSWTQIRGSGTWVAKEGRERVATIERIHATLWKLDYSFSKSPTSNSSGGCYKETAEACKKVFEEIYTGGLRAVCRHLTEAIDNDTDRAGDGSEGGR